MFYTPTPQDEITKFVKKPFILNTNFTETDVFSAINFLASKTNLEYKFFNDKILVQDINDYNSRRRFSLQYKDGSNLIKVNNNDSLFEKTKKVIVIGDNVKATVENPYVKGNDKPIKFIDANIKHAKEAKIKAEQLLLLHSSPSKKITLTMQKDGYELMKPGDIITLNFPNHNVPKDDYIVFEIENAMDSISKITVGTFNKSIAERLSEINLAQDSGFTNVFTKDMATEVTSQFTFDEIPFKEVSLKYQITSPTGALMGYSTTLGYNTTLSQSSDSTVSREIEL